MPPARTGRLRGGHRGIRRFWRPLHSTFMKPAQIAAMLAAAAAALVAWKLQQPRPPSAESGNWKPADHVGSER